VTYINGEWLRQVRSQKERWLRELGKPTLRRRHCPATNFVVWYCEDATISEWGFDVAGAYNAWRIKKAASPRDTLGRIFTSYLAPA
jgi:hypothetical protein